MSAVAEGVKIDHVGVAVRDSEAALRFYTDVLGLAVGERVTFRGLKIAFVAAGEGKIEFLEPVAPESSVGRFLETRGEGVHHIAFAVPDVEAALAAAKAAGYELIDEKPRPGAEGGRIAFLHPNSLHGILVEFCEPDR